MTRRPWDEAELDAIESAWDSRDPDELGRFGVAFTPSSLAQLDQQRRTLSRRLVLLAISDAISSESGIGLRERQDFMYAGLILAVTALPGVVVLVGHGQNKGMVPSDFWPALRPWYRNFERNRPRLDTWLSDPRNARVELALTDSPIPQVEPADQLAQLRSAVAASPDDLAPRRVLADLLLQRGDAHGELINLALELDGRMKEEKARPHFERLGKLMDEHGTRIAAHVARTASTWKFRRGFVESVTMSAAKFNTHGAQLIAEHPIVELILKPVTSAAVETLAESPALSKLRELVLENPFGNTRDVPLFPIGRSKQLASLRRLSLTRHLCRDWTKTFTALDAPALTTIELESTEEAFGPLTALLENERVPRLSRIKFNGSVVTELRPERGDVQRVFKAMSQRAGLRSLEFSSIGSFGAADWKTLFSGPGGRGLEALDLDHASFGDRELEAICDAGPLALRSISLSGTKVGAALVNFLRSKAAARLERLICFAAEWTPEVRAAIADCLEQLPASHPLRYVGVSLAPFPARFVDANWRDHPEVGVW